MFISNISEKTNFFNVDGSFDFCTDGLTAFFGETWDLKIDLYKFFFDNYYVKEKYSNNEL